MANMIVVSIGLALTLVCLNGNVLQVTGTPRSNLYTKLDMAQSNEEVAKLLKAGADKKDPERIGKFSLRELLSVMQVINDKCTLDGLVASANFCNTESVADNVGLLNFVCHYRDEQLAHCDKIGAYQQIFTAASDRISGHIRSIDSYLEEKKKKKSVGTRRMRMKVGELDRLSPDFIAFQAHCDRLKQYHDIVKYFFDTNDKYSKYTISKHWDSVYSNCKY